MLWGILHEDGSLRISKPHFDKDDFTIEEARSLYRKILQEKSHGHFSLFYCGYLLVELPSGSQCYVFIEQLNGVSLPRNRKDKTIYTKSSKDIVDYFPFGYHL